jgi:hypothetical protein
MSYWKESGKNFRTLDNFSLVTTQTNIAGGALGEFYELELGIVLDIVLDETHAIFSVGNKLHSSIDADRWPEDLEGKLASRKDKDLSWIGRALIRPLQSEKTTEKASLPWAFPLEGNFSEYPLINETVILVRYIDKWFYTKKVNLKNWPHGGLDFGIESSNSGVQNPELYSDPSTPYKGPKSVTKYHGGNNYEGVAGRYYISNNKIRTVKRYEGDLLIESRFGQTIHFTSYDKNRNNDIGHSGNTDYRNGGNPMILIRNRQRPLLKQGQKLELKNSPNKSLIIGTEAEKNVGGYLEENINHDGSSIHITSGQTISEWVTTCYKKMFGSGEEVPSFNGKTDFKYPVQNGDQIVVNTDRLILSSRYGETFHFSKKRYGVVTDNEYSVDAHQQMVLTSNTKVVINSPAIYLGEYDVTDEPALLGQTTVNWLYEMCNWLLEHTHWYLHSHVDAGKESPSQTQLPVQVQRLISLRDKLHTLMSKRVFLTGGGLAKGQNGGEITDGTPPVKINTSNGNGVPGGWKGSNYRPS